MRQSGWRGAGRRRRLSSGRGSRAPDAAGAAGNGSAFPAISSYPSSCGRIARPQRRARAASVLAALARSFQVWHQTWVDEGFAPIRAAWLPRAAGLGDEITVRLDRERIVGRFRGIEADGALALDTIAGLRRIAAGDVFPAIR